MERDSPGCIVLASRRARAAKASAALLLIVVGYAVFVVRQGGFTTADVVVLPVMVLLLVFAPLMFFFSFRYQVSFCEGGIVIDHPLESVSIEWLNLRRVREEAVGVVVLEVYDESAVGMRVWGPWAYLKAWMGRPLVTVSTSPLEGGQERFLRVLEAERRKWA